jgi:hypothetical protein
MILDKHYRCMKVVLRPLSQRKPNISKEERSKKRAKKEAKSTHTGASTLSADQYAQIRFCAGQDGPYRHYYDFSTTPA